MMWTPPSRYRWTTGKKETAPQEEFQANPQAWSRDSWSKEIQTARSTEGQCERFVQDYLGKTLELSLFLKERFNRILVCLFCEPLTPGNVLLSMQRHGPCHPTSGVIPIVAPKRAEPIKYWFVHLFATRAFVIVTIKLSADFTWVIQSCKTQRTIRAHVQALRGWGWDRPPVFGEWWPMCLDNITRCWSYCNVSRLFMKTTSALCAITQRGGVLILARVRYINQKGCWKETSLLQSLA